MGQARNLILRFCVVVFCFWAGAVLAQSDQTAPEPTAEQTEDLFQRAEGVIESGQASVSALATLRQQLAEVRDVNTAVVEGGSVEARAIQAQLDSLGPPPAEGLSEAEEIASRRAELSEAVAKANKPIREAQEALKRTELLIGEVDRLIRKKSAELLLLRYPSPIWPPAWGEAYKELDSFLGRFQREFLTSIDAAGTQHRIGDVAPFAIILAVVGLALAFVIQPLLAGRLERGARQASRLSRRWLLWALANMMRLVLPVIASLLILLILPVLGITTTVTETLLPVMPNLFAILVFAHWLGHTVFSPTAPEIRLLTLSDGQAWHGLHLCQALGVISAADYLITVLEAEALFGFSDATVSVLNAPIIILAGLSLWRLAGLLRAGTRDSTAGTQPEEDARSKLDTGFSYIIVMLMRITALGSVVIVLPGYVHLARRVADSMTLTIVWLGLALFLYNVIINIFNAFLGQEEGGEEATLPLFPIAVIFFMTLLFLPLLALSWGARSTDLAEVWRLMTNGVQIGDVNLSLGVVVTLVVVFTFGVLLTRWFQRLLKTSVLTRTRLDKGAQNALVTGVGYAGLTLAALIAVSSAGLNLSSLAFVAGALSLGIGFGLQTIVSNFVSGIILLVERPIKEGDWIEVSGHTGFVRKIAVRSTRIETFDRHDVIVPNQDLIAGTVKNMTLSSQSGRLVLPVGVAYGSDLQKTKEILEKAAANEKSIQPSPAPDVLFIGLGASSLDFELRCFLRDVTDAVKARSNMLFEIYSELEKAGIEIPFTQQDIHLRDVDRIIEAITGRAGAPASKELKES